MNILKQFGMHFRDMVLFFIFSMSITFVISPNDYSELLFIVISLIVFVVFLLQYKFINISRVFLFLEDKRIQFVLTMSLVLVILVYTTLMISELSVEILSIAFSLPVLFVVIMILKYVFSFIVNDHEMYGDDSEFDLFFQVSKIIIVVGLYRMLVYNSLTVPLFYLFYIVMFLYSALYCYKLLESFYNFVFTNKISFLHLMRKIIMSIAIIILLLYMINLSVYNCYPKAFIYNIDSALFVSKFDLLYYSSINFTSVGFGDIVPGNDWSKVIAIYTGIITTMFIFGGIASFISASQGNK